MVIFYCVSIPSQDPCYPLVMYQLLQECWQHDSSKRPAAENLKRGIEIHSGLSHDGGRSNHAQVLLDSFLFIPGWSMVATCVAQNGEMLTICTALVLGDQLTTRIVLADHDVTAMGTTQLRTQVQLL